MKQLADSQDINMQLLVFRIARLPPGLSDAEYKALALRYGQAA